MESSRVVELLAACAARLRPALTAAAVSGDAGLACVACMGVLRAPVTLHCGHTRCRGCRDDVECAACGACPDLPGEPETNIVVRGLVEKWWPAAGEAAELREQGERLFDEHRVQEALDKYDQALVRAPHDHLVLSQRSRALRRLDRGQAALADADTIIGLKPMWAKGHYRRGSALCSLQRYEEALVALCLSAALDFDHTKVQTKVELALNHMVSADDSVESTEVKLRVLLECALREARRLSASDGLALTVDQRLVEKTDFDCILCCRMLWRPVTTPCGHTYCWSCLDRCLDYSSACPLCMTSLNNYLCTSGRSTTAFIERALTTLLPIAYADRAATHHKDWASLGPHIPLFVCTTSFPCVPCPLFVYEPRYRNMVRRCMASNAGRFGMVACLSREPGAKRYAEYGTMQEIKDCVLMADGCSLVTTVGRRRFRVMTRGERDGYDTAQVEMLRDQPILPEQMTGMNLLHARVRDKSVRWFYSTNRDVQAEIARTFGHMPDVEEDWANCDGPAWTWWLLAILPLGPRLQVSILATTNLEKRLRAIDKTLDHIQRCRPVPYVRQLADEQPMDVGTATTQGDVGAPGEGFQQQSSLGARGGCFL